MKNEEQQQDQKKESKMGDERSSSIEQDSTTVMMGDHDHDNKKKNDLSSSTVEEKVIAVVLTKNENDTSSATVQDKKEEETLMPMDRSTTNPVVAQDSSSTNVKKDINGENHQKHDTTQSNNDIKQNSPPNNTSTTGPNNDHQDASSSSPPIEDGTSSSTKIEETTAPTSLDGYTLHLKSQYVLDELPSTLTPMINSGRTEDQKKVRGMNRKRPRDAKQLSSDKICLSILKGLPCKFQQEGKTCQYGHDLTALLKERDPDIPELKANGITCPHYDLLGQCPYGILCRIGETHLNLETGENLTKKQSDATPSSKEEAPPQQYQNVNTLTTMNTLQKDVQIQLRKNTYPFQTKRHFENGGNKKKGGKRDNRRNNKNHRQREDDGDNKKDETTSEANSKKTIIPGQTFKEDVPMDLSPVPAKERKLIDFSNKVYVAPLTTVGNLPFRRIMKQFGADITCGEMAVGANLLSGQSSEWALLKRHKSEDIFGVQIACGHADMYGRVAELIEKEYTVDFMDLNLGCPIDIMCNKGCGAALMTRDKKLKESLEAISKVSSFPVTIKMRTGWDEKKPFAHQLVPKIQQWQIPGVSAIMIHGRSRLQRYTKLSDWDYITKDVLYSQSDQYPRIPLIGNGDIFSYTDYAQHVEAYKATDDNPIGLSQTAMLGRGALIKPWLPTEIKERRHWDISASERLDVLKDFTKYGLEHWGTDQHGINHTRRFLLEFLSFLYRYIPVGMLERLPQQMNERPPKYICGRSDLETLMLSKNCADWIKISEMLLGKVPDGFQFQPKHKANGYKD